MIAAWYWDASAIISALIHDEHSPAAMRWLRPEARHIVSSLAWTEAQAVIARTERAGHRSAARAARADLEQGYWQYSSAVPAFEMVPALAQRWALRGADLWLLSLALTLRAELPGLRLLTFDARLAAAAAGEGLAAPA